MTGNGLNPAIKNQWFSHIETSQLICFANQLPGFYMMEILVVNVVYVVVVYGLVYGLIYGLEVVVYGFNGAFSK